MRLKYYFDVSDTKEGKYPRLVRPVSLWEIQEGQEIKKFEIDLEQYVVYRKVIERTINNGTGSYVIARFLNEQGYKTANGKKFTSKAVIRILSAKLARGFTNEG